MFELEIFYGFETTDTQKTTTVTWTSYLHNIEKKLLGVELQHAMVFEKLNLVGHHFLACHYRTMFYTWSELDMDLEFWMSQKLPQPHGQSNSQIIIMISIVIKCMRIIHVHL